MQIDLVGGDAQAPRITLADFAAVGDKAGAVRRIRSLRGLALDQEVLSAGFTMISRKHGLQAVISHVMEQFDNA